MAEDTVKTARRSKRKLVIILLAILLLAAVGGCGYWFVRYRHAVNDSPEARQKQYTSELAKIIVTPSGQPVITTIVDASKLTNKTLAAEAHNGDQLFIFSSAHRIILYRPSTHKVVDMLTITPNK